VVPGLAVPILPTGIAVVRIDDPAATRPAAVALRAGPASRGRPEPTADLDAFVEALRDVAAQLAAEVRQRMRAAR